MLADTLTRSGQISYFGGDFATASRANEAAMQTARDCGNRWAMGNSRFVSAYSPYWDQGEVGTALALQLNGEKRWPNNVII